MSELHDVVGRKLFTNMRRRRERACRLLSQQPGACWLLSTCCTPRSSPSHADGSPAYGKGLQECVLWHLPLQYVTLPQEPQRLNCWCQCVPHSAQTKHRRSRLLYPLAPQPLPQPPAAFERGNPGLFDSLPLLVNPLNAQVKCICSLLFQGPSVVLWKYFSPPR